MDVGLVGRAYLRDVTDATLGVHTRRCSVYILFRVRQRGEGARTPSVGAARLPHTPCLARSGVRCHPQNGEVSQPTPAATLTSDRGIFQGRRAATATEDTPGLLPGQVSFTPLASRHSNSKGSTPTRQRKVGSTGLMTPRSLGRCQAPLQPPSLGIMHGCWAGGLWGLWGACGDMWRVVGVVWGLWGAVGACEDLWGAGGLAGWQQVRASTASAAPPPPAPRRLGDQRAAPHGPGRAPAHRSREGVGPGLGLQGRTQSPTTCGSPRHPAEMGCSLEINTFPGNC